eukprot:jgi/Galph1/2799/GphlegSOOS_G1486.1
MVNSQCSTPQKVLAPMVRIGVLPMRLLALEYGADLVYSEEIIDRNFIDSSIRRNNTLGITEFLSNKTLLPFFSTCERESEKLIVQLGTSNANMALEAAQKVLSFCSGIDINMGCPLEYSTKGGMGSSLLKNPTVASDIIKVLRRNIPNEYSVTAKIRLLSSIESTIDFVQLLERSGADAVAIHARQVDERPRDAAHWEALAQVASRASVPLLGNGDILSWEDMSRMKQMTGISRYMIARMAQWNVSIFQGELDSLCQVIPRYLALVEETNTYYGLAKYSIQQMIKHEKWTRTTFASQSLLLPSEPSHKVSLDVARRSEVKRLVSLFWRLAKPYWLEEETARKELGVVVALTVLQSGVSVAFSFIGRDFWNALSEKNTDNFQQELGLFFCAMLIGIPILVLYSYFREILSIHWREWLSDRILTKYFEKRNFYLLESNVKVDNPDQRIAEDIRAFTNTSLQFILTLLISSIDLVSFSFILFSIYPELFIILVGYASVGTFLTYRIGNRLIILHFERLQKEADFRYSLVRVRENVESIAFYGGEQREKQVSRDRLGKALSKAIDIAKWQRNLEVFTTSYRYLIQVLPAWVVAPLYFQGSIGLGVISQSISAFNHILNDLSIIVNRFEQLSQFSAGIDRLGEFLETIEGYDRDKKDRKKGIQRIETDELTLQLKHLSVMIPSEEQRYLVRSIDLNLSSEQRLLIVGPSGKGKSSLLRVIAGLWTNGEGLIRCPAMKDTFFLPQRPYCTLGTLREQLLYPRKVEESSYSDQELLQALEKVELLDLYNRFGNLDVTRDWSDTLSLGEQQRLAFGRLFLFRPKFVLMDEASSALDLNSEKELYSFLQESGIMYASVGHRPSLLR